MALQEFRDRYLVISYDGKLQDRYVGFPGVDILQRDLLRAME